MNVNIFVQARMSSSRFPGKMLAPIHGIPLIELVLNRLKRVKNKDKLVVLTSSQKSDDPLATYIESIGCLVFRGELDNVFKRFQDALKKYPCDYFVRICADSPLIDPLLVDAMIENAIETGGDVISNARIKTFPKGQSVEIMKSKIFSSTTSDKLTTEELEHVMPYFYKNQLGYRGVFFESAKNFAHINQCIDTFEDLKSFDEKINQYIFCIEDLCKN